MEGLKNTIDKICERILWAHLSKMKKGVLTILMPGGRIVKFGSEKIINSQIEHEIFNKVVGYRADIKINDIRFFRNCILAGDIGFGESYEENLWETPDLKAVISWFIDNADQTHMVSHERKKRYLGFYNIISLYNKLIHRKNKNSLIGSKNNIQYHYDLNNEFFKLFLDPSMTYSSAYFNNFENNNLELAQKNKIKKLCDSLQLCSSDTVLEIGSGWGSCAVYMAQQYGCKILSITLSEQQLQYAREKVKNLGLSHLIEFQLKDFRNVEGTFDKIISIEMMEALGDKLLPVFFSKVNSLLKMNGIFSFQVITCPDSRYDQFVEGVDWIQKYIFPGSLLLSVGRMVAVLNQVSNLQLFNLIDLGKHYEKTLSIWKEQFESNLDEIKNIIPCEKFHRRWRYYLKYCEAAFATRNISVVQMTLTRPNNNLLSWPT